MITIAGKTGLCPPRRHALSGAEAADLRRDDARTARPFPLRRDRGPDPCVPVARRSRRRPTSPSSAAATPGCRRRCIWPRPASTWWCSRRSGSAGARRAGTAASFTRASGATRTGWRSISASTTARRLWPLAEEAKALTKGLIAKHAIACDWRPGLIETVHKQRLVAGESAYVDKLKRRYGYAPVEWLDRDALAAAIGTGRLFRRPARHGRRPPRSAEICAGTGAGGGERPGRASTRGRGYNGDRHQRHDRIHGAYAGGGDGPRRHRHPRRQRLSRRHRRRDRGAGDADRQLHPRHRADRRRDSRAASSPAARRSPTRASSSTTSGRRPTAGWSSAAARPTRQPARRRRRRSSAGI